MEHYERAISKYTPKAEEMERNDKEEQKPPNEKATYLQKLHMSNRKK